MSASLLVLSYPCLKSVIKELQIDKRKPLAKVSLQFRKIDNQLVYRVNCLKFVLKKGSDKAMLSIDSVKWVFEKKDGLVVVKCSVDPMKVVELPGDEFRVPWEYFQHFMNSERIQICKLELVGCQDPFRNLTRFNVPFLKWTFDRRENFLNFDSAENLANHQFEKLELRSLEFSIVLEKAFVKNAKKLVISQKEAMYFTVPPNVRVNGEAHSTSYEGLQNPILHATIHLSQIETFIEMIGNLLKNPHGIGSFYKATFRKASFTQQFLWKLLEKYFDAKKMSLDRESCWNCMTISDDDKLFEVNCYVDFRKRQNVFRGYLAIANLSFIAVKMEKGTAVRREWDGP